jgi:hypothetical protein
MAVTLLADRQFIAPAAADSVAITPSGVAWTNSAYVTLLAATPAACVLTGVTIYTTDGSASTANYDAEIDIATGAVGVEVVIATMRVAVDRISTATQTGPTHGLVLPIPIDNIGSGVRLSARLRKNNTNLTTWTVAVSYLVKPLTSTPLMTAVAQKALPSAAAGVLVTANATPWANGAWVQLRAASGAALVITGVVFGAPQTELEYELDLGTGAAAAETVITTLRVSTDNLGLPCAVMLPTPLDNVGAGVRVAARARSSNASTTMVVSLMVLEKPL